MDNTSAQTLTAQIDALIGSVGLREPVPFPEVAPVFDSPDATAKSIRKIAEKMGLPVRIELSYVPKVYSSNSSERFVSNDMSTVDEHGRGRESISAQVLIPQNLPMMGSAGLRNFPIKVRISESCKEQPETFVAIMAHELSHIVLNSLFHPKRDDEPSTDLTAMILGFAEIMSAGRRVFESTETSSGRTERTTTYGYLSDSEFACARNYIAEAMKNRREEKRRVISKVAATESLRARINSTVSTIKTFLKILDRHPGLQIASADVAAVVRMHSLNYFDDYEGIAQCTRPNEIGKFSRALTHYTDRSSKVLLGYESELDALASGWDERARQLDADKKALLRSVGLWNRIKHSLGW